MKQLTAQKLVLTLALLASSICIFSFRQNDTTEQKTFRKEDGRNGDTIPRSKRSRSENDFRLRDLKVAMRHLNEQMEHLNIEMKNIDLGKIEKEINDAARESNEVISKEAAESLARIDWNKIEKDISKSLEKVKNVDMVRLKEDLNKMKVDLSKQEIEIKINAEKIRNDVGKAMESAKESMEKAKIELQLMKEFTDKLEEDKLIDKKKPFKIEVKEGKLYINGEKQPQNISDKYKKYYKKENFSINNDGKDKEGVEI